MRRPVLYLFGSAAPPVHQFPDMVRRARGSGFDICVGLTPTAARWLAAELPLLEELTDHVVRSDYKSPGEVDMWPKADVIVFAPATFNSVNSWALGLTHDFVVGVVAEGAGKGIPIVAMPCVNSAYASHPQFDRSVETLRSMGVHVLYGEGGFEPNEPGKGRPEEYPWHLALGKAQAIVSPRP
ncbi:flavoprotein [Streptomyces sp. WAC 06725]|uniref:flavoprotein n=1 Tax=Streptomyces sp. WAC 06725 TaxID=2203209 RepID=UPI000F73B2D5|nr:flavoprotein [Streptomyces sp. WAC 06725]RSO46749.1 flavoprotein [Streptomyces sp. WAC 06725]